MKCTRKLSVSLAEIMKYIKNNCTQIFSFDK